MLRWNVASFIWVAWLNDIVQHILATVFKRMNTFHGISVQIILMLLLGMQCTSSMYGWWWSACHCLDVSLTVRWISLLKGNNNKNNNNNTNSQQFSNFIYFKVEKMGKMKRKYKCPEFLFILVYSWATHIRMSLFFRLFYFPKVNICRSLFNAFNMSKFSLPAIFGMKRARPNFWYWIYGEKSLVMLKMPADNMLSVF